MGIGNIFAYIYGILYSIFGMFFGTIVYTIILIFLLYILDKIYLGFMKERYFGRTEPKYPKLHISYWIDKYLFKKIKLVD